MDKIVKRLKSKTYWAALIGAALTIAELNSGVLSRWMDPSYREYVVLFWPVIMLALRELTKTALEDK